MSDLLNQLQELISKTEKINELEKRIAQLENENREPLNQSIEEWCEENKCSRVTFHKAVKAGLPKFKLGRKTLINREAGRAWIAEKGGSI